MPPKRSKAKPAADHVANAEADTTVADKEVMPDDVATAADQPAKGKDTVEEPAANGDSKKRKQAADSNPPASQSKKRKADDTTKEPSKASRQSSRNAPKAQPSHQQMLNYLLSSAAADMCRPEDEIKDIESRGKDLRTYSHTALTPFEELLCAIVLSRPISHRLGLRTIRTILNAPYGFTSPKAIKSFTPEQRHQAMFDARTQHKDKTASQIGLVADVVASQFGKDDADTSLDKMRELAHKDWDEERDLLQRSVKGLGKTGLDIFFRRVQWAWPEAFPFVDERTARGIEKLGLPKNPDELYALLSEHWGKLDTSGIPKGADKESAKRRAFVIVCERATGGDLEGKSEAVVEAAAAAAA